MRFLVQKFGGTSLSTAELRERAAAKVIAAEEQGYRPVVVVSAMGRQGDPYSTDSLLGLAEDLRDNVTPRDKDLLMSCGEIISGVLVAATLRKYGRNVVFLSGPQAGIITNAYHNEARILRVKPKRIIEAAEEGKIVVVAGFQGVTEDGEITTLGRGGSDTTAAALGVALNAVAIDIYTDVDGVMTADPRIVTEAKPLEKVTYNEICQLAQEGAKVIHPRAVEIAMQKNIPLWIKSTFSDAPGTLITNHAEVFNGSIDITSDRLITGITYIQHISQIKVAAGAEVTARQVFRAMADAGVSVDLINVHPDVVAFTVKDLDVSKAVRTLEDMGCRPEVTAGCAKIAAVGAGMTGVPGVMARIVEALADQGIEILQSADSYTTIWVLVRRRDMEKAIRALYEKFHLREAR
ncbi:aspartate kinase [Desulforudis sp. DRI-14]|uniref:aspartate kinase n=1 Tax=Desulforudis sp. DRI-14 TaxID=3459793 RepID=UPI004041E84F